MKREKHFAKNKSHEKMIDLAFPLRDASIFAEISPLLRVSFELSAGEKG
jgi:hypothetical protein